MAEKHKHRENEMEICDMHTANTLSRTSTRCLYVHAKKMCVRQESVYKKSGRSLQKVYEGSEHVQRQHTCPINTSSNNADLATKCHTFEPHIAETTENSPETVTVM